jgi:hypothetical protein
MMVNCPGPRRANVRPHHCTPVPTLTGMRQGHATADRMAAGVISPHRRMDSKMGVPDSLGAAAPGRQNYAP